MKLVMTKAEYHKLLADQDGGVDTIQLMTDMDKVWVLVNLNHWQMPIPIELQD